MPLSRYIRYFKRRTKRRILNLLSLEFGDTPLSGISLVRGLVFIFLSSVCQSTSYCEQNGSRDPVLARVQAYSARWGE